MAIEKTRKLFEPARTVAIGRASYKMIPMEGAA